MTETKITPSQKNDAVRRPGFWEQMLVTLKILVGAGAFDSEKHCGYLPLQSKATDLEFKQYKSDL